ncbi:MAG TPA: site-specific integrase [Pseudonocardiaceae bacterium]|nr:site-specific integrase [Pseudonocardiaceae bacterium]
MARKKRAEGTRAPNNTSSIYQGSDGYWHGRVTMGVLDDGRPDRRHVQSKDEGKVRKQVRELENSRDSGTVRKPGQVWTLEKWLTHWIENIAAGSVRPTTMVGYRTSVYKHLIPGIGAHRLDKLEPEHLEKLYRRMVDSGLKPATAHLAHRTVRIALNEALRRKHMTANPAKVAKPPRVVEDEIVPFTMDEARQILGTAKNVRNGARFVVALTLGLRRGEALGLKWSDLDIQWQHGCAKGSECRTETGQLCPLRQIVRATLDIRRAVQQYIWQHGCSADKPCGHRYGAHCPKRHGGGVVTAEVKSRAAQRTIGLPLPLILVLEDHGEQQAVERARAGDLWHDEGWVFTNHIGKPTHPTVDHEMWKSLLKRAGVRDARLHDARHTAATMLLVLKVPLPAVMEIMGWSDAAVAKRYMHVPNELVAAIAQQVTDLLWTTGAVPDDDGYDAARLTDDQRTAVRRLTDALPEPWRSRFAALLDEDGEDGPTSVLVTP